VLLIGDAALGIIALHLATNSIWVSIPMSSITWPAAAIQRLDMSTSPHSSRSSPD